MKLSLYFFSADGDRDDRDKYAFALDAARFADVSGFHAVWTPERHFQPFGGLFPNPCVFAGALATATRHVQIRAGSLVLPLHGAVRTAENWALLDNLSGGRVGVSLASGWHRDDYVMAPEAYGRRKEILFDQIQTVRRLWAGETVEITGVDGRAVQVKTYPRPIQPELPIWITANSPASWAKAAEVGANIFTSVMGSSVERLAKEVKAYRRRLIELGQDPRRREVTVMVHTYVGEDPQEVRELCREPLRRYLRTYFEQFRGTEHTEFVEGVSKNLDAILDFSVERYFSGTGLIGVAETCRAFVGRLRAAGVTEIACLVDFGIDDGKARAGLERLAELRRSL